MDNAGKLAVVTGASSGIGYELAAQFAQAGFDLFIVAEDDGITQAAEDLRQLGTDVQSAQIDLASHEGCDTCYAAIAKLGRPVAAAALNAGIGVDGKFWETDIDKEMKLIDLNVMSTTHLAKRIIQGMVECAQGGKILFTASVAGRHQDLIWPSITLPRPMCCRSRMRCIMNLKKKVLPLPHCCLMLPILISLSALR